MAPRTQEIIREKKVLKEGVANRREREADEGSRRVRAFNKGHKSIRRSINHR